MTAHWKAILGVTLIFVLGFTSGVVCSSIFVHRKLVNFLRHPGAITQAALEKKLTKDLGLDENQKKQIHDLFTENLKARREINKQVQPQVRIANLDTFQKINSVLRPDQQETFRKNLEETRNRFSKVAGTADLDDLPVPGVSASTAPASTSAPQH